MCRVGEDRSAGRNHSRGLGHTLTIYCGSRLAKLELKEAERPKIDPEFEEATDGDEVEREGSLKCRWAQLDEVFGSESSTQLIARDLVEHFENRLAAMGGKAMVVVMRRTSRRRRRS